MLVGVFSDVHDNLKNLNIALDIFRQREIKTLVFCGDFCSPIPSRVMGKYDGVVHCVFGNGDGDRFQMLNIANNYSSLKIHGEYAELEFGGVRVAVTHYPFYGEALASTGKYQAVFAGHTHEQAEKRIGDCLFLNPGEVLGWKGNPTCAVYDTDNNSAEIVKIG